MRIVFFGTGNFGVPSLKKILLSDHDMVLAVTRPDSVSGRGWKRRATPVRSVLEKVSPATDILQPEDLSDPGFLSRLERARADIFIVIDYGKILKQDVLRIPSRYCLNLHPSLLPKYRGPAPINHAILNGEKETGNTVIRMDERMDAGPVISSEKTAIGQNEDAAGLFEKLADKGADLLLKSLGRIEEGKEVFTAQDEREASYAPKLRKDQGRIEWGTDAREIANRLRAFKPWPGIYTYTGGKSLKIIEAVAEETPAGVSVPATVISTESGLVVSSGKGALRILRLQPEGKRVMTWDEFLRGHSLPVGTILG